MNDVTVANVKEALYRYAKQNIFIKIPFGKQLEISGNTRYVTGIIITSEYFYTGNFGTVYNQNKIEVSNDTKYSGALDKYLEAQDIEVAKEIAECNTILPMLIKPGDMIIATNGKEGENKFKVREVIYKVGVDGVMDITFKATNCNKNGWIEPLSFKAKNYGTKYVLGGSAFRTDEIISVTNKGQIRTLEFSSGTNSIILDNRNIYYNGEFIANADEMLLTPDGAKDIDYGELDEKCVELVKKGLNTYKVIKEHIVPYGVMETNKILAE